MMKDRIILKAGAVTNLTDARFFAAYGVDYIGFCFDPQDPSYISPEQAMAIAGWISGPRIVAEFAHQDAGNVANILSFMQADVAELGPEYFDRDRPVFAPGDIPWIRRLPAEEEFMKEYTHALFLLANPPLERIKQRAKLPVMADIAEGYDPAQYPEIRAFQVRGSREEETGIRDYEALGRLLETLRAL